MCFICFYIWNVNKFPCQNMYSFDMRNVAVAIQLGLCEHAKLHGLMSTLE